MQDAKPAPPLPTDHAFVVQFRAHTPGQPLRWDGRVEHLVSGQATHFSSWDQLQQFIARVLANLADKPP
jgi:hypothetical protein